MARHGALLFLSLWLVGCQLLGGLNADAIATNAQRPSNVAMYLVVEDGDEPVTDLEAGSFRVYEDGQLVTAAQSSQTLLDRSVAAVHHAALLLDLSGKPGDAEGKSIVSGAESFVRAVAPKQAVTVFAFDGSARISRLVSFERGAADTSLVAAAVDAFNATDPSSNLHGAVVEALSALDSSLMREKKPLRIGTLAVLARGPDLAKRVPREKMLEAIEESGHRVVAIGVGEDTGDFRLEDVGPDGVFRADTQITLPLAFENAATRIGRHGDAHYLLAYCSPARSGSRQLEVQVVIRDAEGNESTASAHAEFDATGFGPGCDPSTPPRFFTRPASVEAPPADDSGAPEPPPATSPPTEPKKPPQPSAPAKPEPAAPEKDDEVVPPPSKPGYAPN